MKKDAAVLDSVFKKIRKLLRRQYVSQMDRVFKETLDFVVDFTYFDDRPAFKQQKDMKSLTGQAS
jgi:uncharacterized protein YnzC (UPF0291/DUF896 family)